MIFVTKLLNICDKISESILGRNKDRLFNGVYEREIERYFWGCSLRNIPKCKLNIILLIFVANIYHFYDKLESMSHNTDKTLIEEVIIFFSMRAFCLLKQALHRNHIINL